MLDKRDGRSAQWTDRDHNKSSVNTKAITNTIAFDLRREIRRRYQPIMMDSGIGHNDPCR